MKLKIQGRQTGKTYDIAQMMKKEKKSICIQPTLMMKDLFCKKFKIKEKRVFTLNEFISKAHLLIKIEEIYMDELGLCLDLFFRGRLKHATFTGEYEVKTWMDCIDAKHSSQFKDIQKEINKMRKRVRKL